MSVFKVITVISLVVLGEAHLSSLLTQLHGNGNRGTYNDYWEVSKYPTFNGPTSENVYVIQDTSSGYTSYSNQRYPINNNNNRYQQVNPNFGQVVRNPGFQNGKPQEETVVVVVYDENGPKNPQAVPQAPTFIKPQQNYAPNNGYVGNDEMIISQIADYFNRQNNGGNSQIYPQPVYNGHSNIPANNNNFDKKEPSPSGQNNYNKKPSYANPRPDQYEGSEHNNTDENKNSQKIPSGASDTKPNYPNNSDNVFVDSTSEKNLPQQSDDADNSEEFSIDVRLSEDGPKKRN